ncbi:MAG: hypothetical protein RLZZ86_364, partial [Cyanobacteriota bacterium]
MNRLDLVHRLCTNTRVCIECCVCDIRKML